MIAPLPRAHPVRRRVILYGLLAAAAVTSVVLLLQSRSRLRPEIRRLAARAAARHQLAPDLVYAVVVAESGGNPNARSKAGAYGLMQLTPETASWLAGETLTKEQILEPARNLDLGCNYLRRLLDRYGDLRLALAAYNAGPGRVDRWRRENPGLDPEALVARAAYGETRHFVKKVLARMKGT